MFETYRSKDLGFKILIATGTVLVVLLLLFFLTTALLTTDVGEAVDVLIGAAPPFPPHAAWAAWSAVPLAILGWIATPIILASIFSVVIDQAVKGLIAKRKKELDDMERAASGL